MKSRVALITHEMSLVGGLPTMVTFLHRILRESGRFEPKLISLATSASDNASLQLRSPSTWLQQPCIEEVPWHDTTFTHAGVWGSELEFQRYRPRLELLKLFKQFDLLQFVVGSPPWACVAKGADRPTLLWTATTTRADRASRQRNGSLFRRAWSSAMMPVTEQYENRALRAADKVFALSEYTRRTIEPIAGHEKVALAPCGVDTELFRPDGRVDGNYILCVARFSDARKNVRLLLDAYSDLWRAAPGVPDLYLIGDPPTKDAQEHLQRLGIAEKVRLVGPKQGEELASLYRNATFFVLSSDEEGLGIVILEAMASGLAVVSTNCGGPATAIAEGRTGLLTPIGDAKALADAMEKLLVEPALRVQMGIEGRRVAEEKFSLAAAGQIFLDTYDQVLSGNLQSERAEKNSIALAPRPLPEQ